MARLFKSAAGMGPTSSRYARLGQAPTGDLQNRRYTNTVTIDAAGCQTEIARRIVDAGGHYVLNVKGNQVTLRDGIEKFFAEYLDGQMPTVPVRQRHSTNTGHGRRESRWHYVCGVPRDLPDRDRWPGLKAIGMVISNTERDGKECGSIR